MLALPTVAVLLLRASPLEVGILAACERLPFPFLSLVAGVWVDRRTRKPIMIVCNLGRALALGSIPLTAAVGALTLYQLYAAGLVSGIFTVFFDVAYLAYLPALVQRTDIVEGNTKLQVSSSAAQVLGPGLAGLLIQVAGAAQAVTANALSYLVSVVSLLAIRKPELKPEIQPGQNVLAGLLEGLRYVLSNRLLTSQIGLIAFTVIGAHMIDGPIFPFLYRNLRLTPGTVGIIFTLGGLGAFAGAALAGPLVRWIGLGPQLALGFAAFPVVIALTPLALVLPPAPVIFIIFFVGVLFDVGANISQLSLRMTITPPRFHGRMNAAFRTVVFSAIPLGGILGGLTATAFGIVPTFYIAAGIGIAGAASIFLSPLGRLKTFPEPAV